MVEEIERDEIASLVQKRAKDIGIRVETLYYTDEFDDKLIIFKECAFSGGNPLRYSHQVRISPRMRTDISIPFIDYLDYEIYEALGRLRDELSDTYEVNGHSIYVYQQDGFYAYDRETGVECSYTVDDVPNYNLFSKPEAEPSASFGDAITIYQEKHDDIPPQMKDTLLNYILGWAWSVSPDEFLDDYHFPQRDFSKASYRI